VTWQLQPLQLLLLRLPQLLLFPNHANKTCNRKNNSTQESHCKKKKVEDGQKVKLVVLVDGETKFEAKARRLRE